MTSSYSLATFRHQGKPTPVIEVGRRYWPISAVAPELIPAESPRGLMQLFDDWAQSHARLARLAARLASEGAPGEINAPRKLEDILAPLLYPNKLIMLGANYLDHMQQDAGVADFEKATKIPVLFMKPPTTAIVGSGASVPFPVQTKKFDWEIELAVVIGQRATRLTMENAMDCVAGYTIGIDLSARDWQFHDKHLVKFDLFGGKAFDSSNPLGPCIVPAGQINGGDLQMTLKVNGEVKQHARTSLMIWSIPEQLVAITEHVTLEPGDIVMTGTPSGVGLKTGTFLNPGDRMDASIEGIGDLVVQVQA
ncbi:fumarylacetoacetate hydrolase family protein [Burkholderia pseudomultivorans]|uniref:Fumarylacetoacetate (FAA) hydrolase family protein n=1 Tax=Burkholderia cenocepacia TaxID=95486 RepID=A0AAN0VQY0_9BURK|nr:fumarylacetoacetate hydrolase family protein [Burkholderia pseudomultivorans]AIO36139.1 fumarylacetoacetate (FAA) hydrolase family protein [Burkholderia cenocepacia]KWF06543.1 4-hydroxyphenylacetate degradation protein [Burkholderia pseudomultivorans]